LLKWIFFFQAVSWVFINEISSIFTDTVYNSFSEMLLRDLLDAAGAETPPGLPSDIPDSSNISIIVFLIGLINLDLDFLLLATIL